MNHYLIDSNPLTDQNVITVSPGSRISIPPGAGRKIAGNFKWQVDKQDGKGYISIPSLRI